MPNNPKECQYCHATGLVWRQVNTGGNKRFLLHNPSDMTIHRCISQPAQPGPAAEVTATPIPSNVPDAAAELWKIIRPAAIADPAVSGAKVVSHEIVVKDAAGEVKTVIEGAHPQTATLLRLLVAGLKPLMVGPAGTGKTKAAEMAAVALDVPFYPLSVGPQTSKSDLLGYSTADGRTVRSALREAFEHGGFFFLDELDAGNPAVLTAINAAIENQFCGFPDGTIKRTDKPFYIAAAANTYGTGATREYCGRNQLDAATLSRFKPVINWGYDANLEAAIAGEFTDWLKFVHAVRAARDRTGIRAIFGTREVLNGVLMLRGGFPLAEVKEGVLFNGLASDDVEKLMANVR